MSEPSSFSPEHPDTVVRRRDAIMVFVNDGGGITIAQDDPAEGDAVCVEVMPEDVERLIAALWRAKDKASQ